MKPGSNSAACTRPTLRALAGSALALLLVSTLPVSGETELVLVDGRVLAGTDVRRDGDNYVLTLVSGDEISLPVQVVESVRLTGSEPQAPQGERDEYLERNPGVVEADPREIAGSVPEGPTGLSSSRPWQLAGNPVRASTPSEQLEAFGESARFQRSVTDNHWTPTTDWDMDPEAQNNWSPSKWSESIVDNSWQPESAYAADADVMKGSRSTWQKGPIDSSWTPGDGFRR